MICWAEIWGRSRVCGDKSKEEIEARWSKIRLGSREEDWSKGIGTRRDREAVEFSIRGDWSLIGSKASKGAGATTIANK